MTDRELMEMAIKMAAQCKPKDVSIPKVGAVIAVEGDVIAAGHRGEHDHAELVALGNVADWSILPHATVYTTLEPCTHPVRTQPGESCTERLIRASVKKIYVGILDPNQGVCGKGVLELQDHDIEVELFPHDLAKEIRLQNDAFILDQKKLGIEIIDPLPNALLHTYKTEGRHIVRFKCKTAPNANIFAFNNMSGQWWPQPDSLKRVENSDEWTIETRFSVPTTHVIHIVRAKDAGLELIAYYRKIIAMNLDRKKSLEKLKLPDEDVRRLWGGFPGIAMTQLPRGLISEACVTVEIAKKPDS